MNSRRRVDDPELRPLIGRIAALVLEEGSVNRAQQVLASRLAADRSEGYIHPNRLHALLSEDPTKSVNPRTLVTIETAAGRLDPGGRPADRPEIAELGERVRALYSGNPGAGQAPPEQRLREVGNELGIPPAAVRLLLGDSEAGRQGHVRQATHPKARVPDWSFQDAAYRKCVQALSAGPGRKIGLILPTGSGKTRVAIRILLTTLERSGLPEAKVVWVTHRKRLRMQATRELQRAVTHGTPDLPAHAAGLLADQVEICMVSKLPEVLDRLEGRVALVVIDEAHHAAAASYETILSRSSLSGLFLTATPNRTDLLPIGIDEIAFSITYRELFEMGVIVKPDLDALTINGFAWNLPEKVNDLADYLLREAEDRFVKTLAVVLRVEHAEILYEALTRLRPGEHVLADDDIGFVHGGNSSTGEGAQDFLDEFQARPRGILIATSSMLGEGYDDPTVDSTVVTYETQSMLELMQVAGRCMRSAPGKENAYVIQLRDSALAYHWEQGWLYQDISDLLRPRLESFAYGSLSELRARVCEILDLHNSSAAVRATALHELEGVQLGDKVSLLLTGLPYSGPATAFEAEARWGAVLVSPREQDTFRRVFNSYSECHEEVNDTKAFLQQYIPYEAGPTGNWKRYVDMLAAMRAAAAERSGGDFADASSRSRDVDTGSTWLTYITFSCEPELPPEVEAFLSDAVNRDAVARHLLMADKNWALALKIPLPLGGTVAMLLDPDGATWLRTERDRLKADLTGKSGQEAFARVAEWQAGLTTASPLPRFAEDRFESILSEDGWNRYLLSLSSVIPTTS